MNEFKKVSTGELIPFYDASLNSGIDSWLWTFNASIADLATLQKLKPTKNLGADFVEVSFKLGLETFVLLIENVDSNDTGYSYSVAGRSKSVLLAEPYSLPITKTWPATTAQTIAQELCDSAGVTLVWGVMDWTIKSYVADKRYPIDIITELANDLGAIVQSLPNGSLTVIYSPVCSPTKLTEQTPDFSVATDTNLFTRARQFINNTNHDRVLITSESSPSTATAPTISFEEVNDGADKLIKVIVSPFVPVSDIHLHHASGENIAVVYEGVYSEQVTDQLIIQNGKAQLSKSFDSAVSVNWHQDVVGTLAIDSHGVITTNEGFGLVTVIYNSKHHRYRFSNLTGVDLTAIAVDEIPAPVDLTALSLEYVMGAGDNIMPPVITKTLSSLEALLKRGESELWKQLYDADDYSIDCAYQNVPMLPAKIALLGIRSEAELFKGWIKSVSIKLDSTITQSVVIERPLL